MRTPLPCSGPCRLFHPGHRLHPVQAHQVGRSPWGWRDAVVAERSGRLAVLTHLEGGDAALWHHEDLEFLVVGEPVRLHEGRHALASAAGVLNVVVLQGLGPLADPADPGPWAHEFTAAVTDEATGRAHLSGLWGR